MKKIVFWMMLFFCFLGNVSNAQNNSDEHSNRIRLMLDKHFAKQEYLSVYLHLDRNFYQVNDTLWFSSYVVNTRSGQLDTTTRIVFLDFIDENNRITSTFLVKSQNGLANGSIVLEPKLHSGNWQLVAYTLSMKNFSENYLYRKNIFIVNSEENDSLIASKYIQPAYKLRSDKRKEKRISADYFHAYEPDGQKVGILAKFSNKLAKPAAIKGKLNYAQNSLEFTFDVSGYAQISDLPLNQKLEISLKRKQIKLNLPKSAEELRIVENAEVLSFLFASEDVKPRFLVQVKNGNLEKLYDLQEQDLAQITMNKKELPNGLNVFLLMSQNYQILAENVYFKEFTPLVEMTKNVDKIEFMLKETNWANVSVSVFKVPELALHYFGNINQSLSFDQLNSLYYHPSWKAKYVHQPKINYKNILQDEFKDQKYEDISEIVISGKVVRFTNIGVEGKVVRLSNSEDYYSTQVRYSESWGKFSFEPVEMIDSAYLFVDAVREAGSNWLSVQLDTMASLYPKYNTLLMIPLNVADYRTRESKETMLWTVENTDMVQMIKKRNQLRNQSTTIYGAPDHVIKVAGTRYENYTSLLDILTTVPGITLMGNVPVIRGISTFYGSIAPLVLLDNTPVSIDILTQLAPMEVDHIDILKSGSNTSMFGSRGGNGVIAIFTKQGDLNTMFAYHFSVPGYAQKRTFSISEQQAEFKKQSPAYTLYWNPNIQVGNDGKFSIENVAYFQGAILRIEGVTESGKPVYFQTKL